MVVHALMTRITEITGDLKNPLMMAVNNDDNRERVKKRKE